MVVGLTVHELCLFILVFELDLVYDDCFVVTRDSQFSFL